MGLILQESRQTFTTSRKLTYSFIHSPANSAKPTLLLLHGFPSHIPDWKHQIEYFQRQGNGVIALDLLGFGDSSKPHHETDYRLKLMSQDIVELLNHLNLPAVVGVSHDLGANLLSRLALYHPVRFSALIFIAVGAGKPGQKFDVDMIHKLTKQHMGFEMFGYLTWLGQKESPHRELEQHAEATMSLMFCQDETSWNQWFHPLGKMEQFVIEDKRLPIGKWYTPDLQQAHLEAFGTPNGYLGVTRWYRMLIENESLADEEGLEDVKLNLPTLFLGHGSDEATMAQQKGMLAEWVNNLDAVSVKDAGHWIHIERPVETNDAIKNFLGSL